MTRLGFVDGSVITGRIGGKFYSGFSCSQIVLSVEWVDPCVRVRVCIQSRGGEQYRKRFHLCRGRIGRRMRKVKELKTSTGEKERRGGSYEKH